MSPYIKQEDRESAALAPATPGELNYAITMLLWEYWQDSEQNYETGNAIMGVCRSTEAEFWWRVMRPYEDKKIMENGDVYVIDD